MPDLVFRHMDDVPFQEVKAQLHGERHAGVHLKIAEWSPGCVFIYTHYDPGLTLEVHGHGSNHVIYVLEGSVTISDVNCTPGMMVLLEHGATFGPIIAGPRRHRSPRVLYRRPPPLLRRSRGLRRPSRRAGHRVAPRSDVRAAGPTAPFVASAGPGTGIRMSGPNPSYGLDDCLPWPSRAGSGV